MNATLEKELEPETSNDRAFLTPEEVARDEVRKAARNLLPILQAKRDKLDGERIQCKWRLEQAATTLHIVANCQEEIETELRAVRLLCDS